MSAGRELVKKVSGWMRMGKAKPVWFETVSVNHPPLSFAPAASTQIPYKKLKPRTLQPVHKPEKLVYPEDRMRRRFYREHPLELDEPISLAETGKVMNGVDGEFVVQRQLELIEKDRMSEEDAYQKACKEFYQKRGETEIAERLAADQHITVLGGKYEPMKTVFERILLEEKAEIEARLNTKK